LSGQITCNLLCTQYSDFWGLAAENIAISLQRPMHGSVRHRSIADALVLLLSYVLLQSASQMRAVASCGDWLAHPVGSHRSAQRSTSVDQRNTDTAASVGGTIASNKDSIPLPCDGPSCRRAPSRPVPVIPPSNVSATDKLLLAGHDVIREPLSRWTFTTGDSSAHAIRGFPADIEHPPRA
jgi:hypothetical protein